MVLRGTIKNGAVVLDEKVELPEGSRVQVDVEQPDDLERKPSAWKDLSKFAGIMKSGRRDGSVNHDHYIYGTPKREPEE